MSFKKPIIPITNLETFKVRISQIPPFDVAFKEMALTDYENLVAVIYRLNELIGINQKYIDLTEDVLEWVMNDGLSQVVIDRLIEWLNDGTLESLINEALFNMKLDKTTFDDFIIQYDVDISKKTNITDFNNFKDNTNDKLDGLEVIYKITPQYLSLWEKLPEDNSDTERIKRCIEWCSLNNKKMYIDEDVEIFVRTSTSGIDTPNVDLPSNFELEFIGGSKMSVLPTDRGYYAAIRLINVDNVKVINPIIIGERDEHIGDTDQQGYGIEIIGCENVYIENPIISKCWGDGIYIGMQWAGGREISKNITVENGIFYKNRRMGLTVASGENILIKNCHAEDTGGSLPSTAFHVEPENEDKTPFIRNVEFIDCHSKNSANAGFGFTSKNIVLSDEFTLNYTNCTDDGSAYGMVCYGNRNNAKGFVNITNLKVRNNKNAGVNLNEYNVNSPKVTFNNIEISNSGRNFRPDYPFYYTPILSLRDSTSNRTYDMGNFVFNNPKIYLDDDLLTYSIYINDLKDSQNSFVNVEIIDPVFKNRKAVYMKGGIILDGAKQLETEAFDTAITLGGSNKVFRWSNVKSNGNLMNFNLSGKYADKEYYVIHNAINGNIRVHPPTGKAINGLGGVNESYESYSKGSRLVLENRGNHEWFVVNKIGTWNKIT